MWLSYHVPVLRPAIRAADVFEPLKPRRSPEFSERLGARYKADVARVEALLKCSLAGEWWLK